MEDAIDSTENSSMQLASQAETPSPTFTFLNQPSDRRGSENLCNQTPAEKEKTKWICYSPVSYREE